jgi:hypothetical protein
MAQQPYKATGTTTPCFIPRDGGQPIQVGQHYFALQVHSAQAAFSGHIWEKARRLIVVSRVSLNHPLLGDKPLQALHRSREVRKGRAEQLGLAPNLINLVPATMDRVSVSIEFILDKENKLVKLTGLINDDSFLAAISLAPGAAMTAKTLGGLAGKLLNTFFQAEERQPILQFAGDFNLASGGLQEGYYAILGTRDDQNPLPRPLPSLSVQDGDLLAGGKPVTQWSYVLFDVQRLDARTRDLGVGQPWYAKLVEAEGIAQDVANDPLIGDEERTQKWQACQKLLRETRTLLNADPNYLPQEAKTIIQAAFVNCREQILEPVAPRLLGHETGAKGLAALDEDARELLDTDDVQVLDAALVTYAEQVARSRQVIQRAGIQ